MIANKQDAKETTGSINQSTSINERFFNLKRCIFNKLKKQGEAEDHTNLLCSLFLGFGMDSYVAIG